jgi:hypothetical protein
MEPLNQLLCGNNPTLSQLLKTSGDDWYIGSSDIAGQGIFAGKPYEEGDIVGVAMNSGDTDDFGAKIWNLTPLARYCNHQEKANTTCKKSGTSYSLIATRAIDQDEEITCSYVQVTRAIGPFSRMYWAGRPVPTNDLEDFVEKESAEKKFKFIHSCCGKPLGECPGCPGGMQLVREDRDV